MENVVTLKTLDSSVLSLIILIIILLNSYNRSDRIFPERKLFFKLVIFNIFIIAVDYLGWAFNGLEGPAFTALNVGANCLLYIAAPAAPMLWMLYVDYQVYGDEERQIKIKRVLLGLLAANAVFSVISLFTGWYFSVDAQNVYSRGPLFFVYIIFNSLLVAHSAMTVLKNKRKLQKRYFYSLLFFFTPPVIGMLLQTFIYGVTYNWVGMAVSVLIVYLNIQNRNLDLDYLTGAYNRRWLEGYKKSRLKTGTGECSFSAIMFDLDNLKPINDEFGHDAGDEALKDTVNIVRRSIRDGDFVARAGGDEFIVILDIQNADILEAAKMRIQHGIAAFNKARKKPYKLSLSYGYRVYNVRSGEKLDDFFKDIDTLMYREKDGKKEKQEE